MNEVSIQRRIMLRASQLGWRVWRNNVGLAWSGKPCTACKQRMRPIKFGLCTGSSDLVGIKPVTVTQEMVGTTVGLFAAIEVKTPKGIATELQQLFLSMVNKFGGWARILRSPDDLQ